jgi:hypothetical protein
MAIKFDQNKKHRKCQELSQGCGMWAKSHVFPFCEIQAKVRRRLKREGLDAAQGEADIRRTRK